MFGVFAAVSMYLSVGGVVRHIASLDPAAAIVQQASSTPAARAPAPFPRVSGRSAAAGDVLEQSAEPVTGQRGCRLALLIDSDCVFD